MDLPQKKLFPVGMSALALIALALFTPAGSAASPESEGAATGPATGQSESGAAAASSEFGGTTVDVGNPMGGNARGPSRMSLLDDEWELKVGDRVVYEVLEEREESELLTINPEGELQVPLIGRVPAEGKTARELAFDVKDRLEEEFFHRATVMISQRPNDRNRGRVRLVGEVRQQGEQKIPADETLTVSQAILQSGGFTADADRSNVRVVSQGEEEEARRTVDVGEMLESGNFNNDPVLQSGDVVIVGRSEQAGGEVYVLGAVQSPGIYTIRDRNPTLSQAILMADGFTRFARKNRVRLVSENEEGEKTEREIDVGRILDEGDRTNDPEIEGGDMIIVEEKMITFGG